MYDFSGAGQADDGRIGRGGEEWSVADWSPTFSRLLIRREHLVGISTPLLLPSGGISNIRRPSAVHPLKKELF